jgi:hypothetical protein
MVGKKYWYVMYYITYYTLGTNIKFASTGDRTGSPASQVTTLPKDFQGPPLPMPLVMMLHPSKSLRTVPHHKNNRYIKSYCF